MNKSQPKIKSQRSMSLLMATGLLIVSLIFVATTFFKLANDAQNEQEWMSHVTDVQVTSQQLAKSAGEAAAGNLDAFLELGSSRKAIAAAMRTLRSGSVSGDLPPTPRAVTMPMKQLNLSWDRMSTNASSILDREKLILELAMASNVVQDNIPGIQKNTD
ncbi:MAG: type IV pili methyl-accepting chemotaxis transducer N-terminal domain-containing protein, partial [Xanthomonadales bacterium]|nr:type IV pili methyl-accepting chemotaxis transducer N-terminal domain-containing protein [Xanthomonadales bacterium]